MNISFNIQDDIGAQFLLAAKWKLGDDTLTDQKATSKSLKAAIAAIIEEYNKAQVLQTDELVISNLRAQERSLREQTRAAEMVLLEKRRLYDSTAVPVVIPDV